MMTEFTWTFNTFEVALSEDGLSNVVKSINWTIRGNDNGVINSVTASTGLSSPNPQTFTNYDDITEQWAIDTVSSIVDVDAIKAGIQSSIDYQKQVVRKVPPFLIPPTPETVVDPEPAANT